MTLNTDEFKTAFMLDGAVVLFTEEPTIHVIEKIEHLLKDVANDAIRKSLERND